MNENAFKCRGEACFALNLKKRLSGSGRTNDGIRAKHASPPQTRSMTLLLVCVVVISIAWSSPCIGDSTAEAKVTFERAVVLFADEDYQGALSAFEKSYQIYPRVSTLFNIGMCQKALLLYVEAIATFNKFVGDEQSKQHPTLRQHAEAALAELIELVGELRLVELPEGSIVQIDGVGLTDSQSTSALSLNPGYHSVVVTLEGRRDFRADVTISPGVTSDIVVVLESVDAISVVERPAETADPSIGILIDGGLKVDGKESKRLFLRTSGIITGVVGLGFVGLGVYNSIRYNQYLDDGNDYVALLEGAEYWDYDVQDHYEDIAKEKIPAASRGMIVGYTVGGTLLAAGITMFLIDSVNNKREEERNVSVTPGGVSVRF